MHFLSLYFTFNYLYVEFFCCQIFYCFKIFNCNKKFTLSEHYFLFSFGAFQLFLITQCVGKTITICSVFNYHFINCTIFHIIWCNCGGRPPDACGRPPPALKISCSTLTRLARSASSISSSLSSSSPKSPASPSSLWRRLAVAISAAWRFRHFVRRFWNHTWNTKI